MRIIITGVRGFVGSHLSSYLMQFKNRNITGASRKVDNIEYLRGKLHDIVSYDDIYKGTFSAQNYIHLAGKVIDINQKGSESEFFEINYEQTKKLFDRFVADDVAEKFIFLSTIHVLTEKPQVVLDEDYMPEPFTFYGKSKIAAENYILENCPPGKKVYVLRPSMIHGPGNKGNLNLLFKLVKRGIPYPLGSVNNKRSFVSVENLCFIIHEIASREIEPGLYHVADDEPTYTHDLIRIIAQKLGKKARFVSINPAILNTFAKFGNVFPFVPINDHRLNKLTSDFMVSNEKIKRAIGKPLPVRSRYGIEKTIESFVTL